MCLAQDIKPAHGFARTSLWEVRETKHLSTDETEITLALKENENSRELWNYSFEPIHTILWEEMKLACLTNQYKIDIEDVKFTMLAIAEDYQWSFLSPIIIETLIMWAVKKHLSSMKSLGDCFLRVALRVP